MTASECEHGDLPDACPPCLNELQRERAKVAGGTKGADFFARARARSQGHRTPRAVIAQFNSECPECGSQIRADVDAVAKGPEGWSCAECVGAAL